MDSAVRLWQLISPALPVGAFSWSQGLEYAVAAGWVRDEATALEWIAGLADDVVTHVDLPIIDRSRQAWGEGDGRGALDWNRRLLAYRETAELLSEDRAMGSALRRLALGLELPLPCEFQGREPVSFAAVFAWFSHHWRIGPAEALAGYLWAWCENQTAAAVKLVPLGQTAGQRLLLALGGRIAPAVQRAQALRDEDIGMTAAGQCIASACHESQYTRLFRS